MKKNIVASMALSATIALGSQPVLAASLMDEKDLAFAFETGNNTNVLMLSNNEMLETEGAYLNLLLMWGKRIWNLSRPVVADASIGALSGSVVYNAEHAGRPSWNFHDFAVATGSGAIGGAVGGVVDRNYPRSNSSGRSDRWGRPAASAIFGAAASGLVNRQYGSSNNTIHNFNSPSVSQPNFNRYGQPSSRPGNQLNFSYCHSCYRGGGWDRRGRWNP